MKKKLMEIITYSSEKLIVHRIFPINIQIKYDKYEVIFLDDDNNAKSYN